MTAGHVTIFCFFLNSKIKIKIQKVEELTRDIPSNGININLIKRTNLRRFNKKKN